jgi:hypothetical protein
MTKGFFLLPVLSLAISPPVVGQTAQPPAQGWNGWAQCQITIQAPGYAHSETHLWKAGGAPTKQGNMEISPMTWTVVGNGSLQRVDGPTTRTAQWTVNGALQNLTIGATNHLDRITLQRWTNHGPARSALTGTEITTINGVPRSRAVVLDVQQWAFPFTATGTTSTRASGSNTVPFDGLRGPMNPPSGATGTAACAWDFARGTSSPAAAPALPTPPPTPATTTTPSTTTTAPPATTPSTTSPPSTSTTPPSSTSAALLSVAPNTIEQGATLSPALTFTGRGTNWRQGTTTVNFGPGIVLQGAVQVQSPTQLTAQVAVPYAAAAGPRAITITTGSEVVTLPNALTVVARRQPDITQITPNTANVGQQGVTVTLTGVGTRWAQGQTVLGPLPGISVKNVTVTSPTSMTVTFDINPSAAAGPRDLTVMNPGPVVASDIITRAGAFTITAAAPSQPNPTAVADVTVDQIGPAQYLNGPASWPVNGIVDYQLGLFNRGPSAADGAVVTVPSTGIRKSNVSCARRSSSLNVDQTLEVTVVQIESGFVIPTFLANDMVYCRIGGNVTGTAGSNVTVTANVAPPSTVTDPNTGSNSATHTLPIK